MDNSSLKMLLLLSIFFIPISAIDEPTSSYIVLLDKSKMPLIQSVLGHEQRYSSVVTKLIHVYSSAIHGFAAHMTETQLREVKKLREYVGSFRDRMVDLHTTHSYKFLKLDSLSGLWAGAGASNGSDVIIGVIDTGVWPKGKSFEDTGLGEVPKKWKGMCEEGDEFSASNCNRKLIGARYYYKGYEAYTNASMNWNNYYKSARDGDGHGTHVASTAGGSAVAGASMMGYASGTATGMAPRARIAVYKVCWGSCAASDILAAISQAVADGVDVISISLGGDSALPYEQDAIAIGAFAASRHGVFVSASAGNSGPAPASLSNVAPWLTSVGSSTIDRIFPATLTLGNRMVFQGQSLTDSTESKSFPLLYIASCTSAYTNASNITGKIVVCGSNGNVSAGIRIFNAGGEGMVSVLSPIWGNLTRPQIYTLPALAVTNATGIQVRQYIESTAKPTARIRFYGTKIGSVRAPQMTYFSSRGPNSITPDVLKPDVIAPGFDILAAWSRASSPSEESTDTRKVDYNIISGTSMSCSHISGIAALLKAAHPAWSPAAIRSAIMTTAYTIDNTGKNISESSTGQAADVFAYGSGHVDPQKALSPGLIYDLTEQDYINFLCSHGYNTSQISTITQNSSISCPSSIPSANDFNYPSLTAALNSTSDVVNTTFGRNVTNVGPQASCSYFAHVVAPKGMNITVTPSTLAFSSSNTTLSFQVQVSAPGQSSNTSLSGGMLTWSDGTHYVRSPITLWFT